MALKTDCVGEEAVFQNGPQYFIMILQTIQNVLDRILQISLWGKYNITTLVRNISIIY